MIDCGILDTDIHPYPDLTKEEIKSIDYLFLTHCHKDHTGAVYYMIQNGFDGLIISSKETIDFANIHYNHIFYIKSFLEDIVLVLYGFSLRQKMTVTFSLATINKIH